MHSRDNWDDLRYVLAVAETGSVSAAARKLGVNHATVLRRVSAFEARHGAAIFEKTATGYEILSERMRVIDAAREVETAVVSVSRAVQGSQAPPRGVVRVTSTDTFCHEILPPIVARMHDTAEELRVELLSTNAHLDLSRLHADITVRPAATLEAELVGDVAARLGFAVYTKNGSTSKRWLALSGAIARSKVAAWLTDHVDPSAFAGAGDSFLTLREMAAEGMGQVILPCILGDPDKRLERRDAAMPQSEVDIWVASHAELVDVPRIRAVRSLLIAALGELAPQLVGRN